MSRRDLRQDLARRSTAATIDGHDPPLLLPGPGEIRTGPGPRPPGPGTATEIVPSSAPLAKNPNWIGICSISFLLLPLPKPPGPPPSQIPLPKAQADAQFFEQKLAEDAKLYAKQKEAESLATVGKAKAAEYVAAMLQALGGNYPALGDYLMIDGGLYQEMARINAGAVSGMQPKISIWTGADGGAAGAGGGVGAGGASGGGAMQQVAGVYKMLPPLLSTVHEQTGMLPPAWMGALPKEEAN